jgi:DnaJ-class molecular chaperone
MPGYDPRCPNCHRCYKCNGNGTIEETRRDGAKSWRERVTCPSCGGKGGNPGTGEHRHG